MHPHLTCEVIVGEPQFGLRLSIVLGDVGRLAKAVRERGPAYVPAEDYWACGFRRGTAVFLTVIPSSTSRVVAACGTFVHEAVSLFRADPVALVALPPAEAGSDVSALMVVLEEVSGRRGLVLCGLEVDQGLTLLTGGPGLALRSRLS